MSPHVPAPAAPITLTDKDIAPWTAPLWRITFDGSTTATPWAELREWGPAPDCRFDPHPPGTPTVHPGCGVLYAAADPVTTFAEVFNDSGVIDRTDGEPALVSWTPSRPLRLVNLQSRRVRRFFGAAAVQMVNDRDLTQAWARALVAQHGDDVDGILSTSGVDNGQVITLFQRAVDVPSFPASGPNEYSPLNSAAADVHIDIAADALGMRVR